MLAYDNQNRIEKETRLKNFKKKYLAYSCFETHQNYSAVRKISINFQLFLSFIILFLEIFDNDDFTTSGIKL